eukprot:gene50860-68079_t
MVIEIDAMRLAARAIPPKNQSPLLVHADRMKPRQWTPQLLEVIAGRRAQILIGRRIVQHLQFPKHARRQICRHRPGSNVIDKVGAQTIIPKADDHQRLQSGANPVQTPSLTATSSPMASDD